MTKVAARKERVNVNFIFKLKMCQCYRDAQGHCMREKVFVHDGTYRQGRCYMPPPLKTAGLF